MSEWVSEWDTNSVDHIKTSTDFWMWTPNGIIYSATQLGYSSAYTILHYFHWVTLFWQGPPNARTQVMWVKVCVITFRSPQVLHRECEPNLPPVVSYSQCSEGVQYFSLLFGLAIFSITDKVIVLALYLWLVTGSDLYNKIRSKTVLFYFTSTQFFSKCIWK